MKNWQGKLILKNLQLNDFRQFEALSVSFDDRLTVFIGVNGSGKTTVVDAITKCLRVFAERIQRPDSSINIRSFFPVSDIRYTTNLSGISVQAKFSVNHLSEGLSVSATGEPDVGYQNVGSSGDFKAITSEASVINDEIFYDEYY